MADNNWWKRKPTPHVGNKPMSQLSPPEREERLKAIRREQNRRYQEKLRARRKTEALKGKES